LPPSFDVAVSRQQYSLGHITLFTSLVLSAAVSFQGASRCIEIFVSSLGLALPFPSRCSGRLWLLRLGYYKLIRSKEQADDWVWIADHTVQVGSEKCLVILGIRLCDLPPPGYCVTHEDLEPLALLPIEHSNGDIVYQQLEETIEKTGIPREIIADHGTDLKSGVERFCQKHPQTCYIYDIKHKTAAILKQELHKDEAWAEFTRLAAQSRRQIQQTSLAALAPPNQKTKARYMNVDVLIAWGIKMITYLNNESLKTSHEFDWKQVIEKLGWVIYFYEHLREWDELLRIVTITESFVRKEGLYRGCYLELKLLLSDLDHSEHSKRVQAQLIAFVEEQSQKALLNERLLGSSEVIESVLGKLKRIEKDQAKSGFTGLLLTVPAMLSITTQQSVQKALETVRTKQVFDWCKEILGKSVQAKRKEAFLPLEQAEQKWDQLIMRE
jgi:hypothetical protein